MVATGCFAAGLVQLTGEEDDKPSLSQLAARMLRAGRKAHIALGAELALGPALGCPAPMLAAGKVDLQISVAAVVLKRGALDRKSVV